MATVWLIKPGHYILAISSHYNRMGNWFAKAPNSSVPRVNAVVPQPTPLSLPVNSRRNSVNTVPVPDSSSPPTSPAPLMGGKRRKSRNNRRKNKRSRSRKN